jgi:D-xylose reductase
MAATTILVPGQKEFKGRPLPLALSPASSAANSPADLVAYVRANRGALLQQALSHGAVLLRGWTATTPEDFADVAEALDLDVFPYVGGAAPRTLVVRDVVFTTNESPPSEPIPFHHEMAQCPSPPQYVLFYCQVPAATGGETPLILSNPVAEYMKLKHPAFTAKVLEHGVQYCRVMPCEDDHSSAIGRSWKATFQCEDKAGAEAAMQKIGTTWTWLPNDDVATVTAVVPALRPDPRTGADMFINAMVAAYTGWVDSRNDPVQAVQFGNGEKLTPAEGAVLVDIEAFMMRTRVVIPWQQGDVILIDNGVCMHSRNTFERPRRILAALGGARKETVGAQAPGPLADMPMRTLRSGDRMPAVGFGCWKVPKDVCAETVYNAIQIGYRHFDEACDYGNEKEVGAGIARAVREGLVTREELWITSKLWNTYHAPEHVEAACRKSLDDLGLEYLDLYLIHFPISLKFVPFETRYPPEWVHDPAALKPCMEFAQVPMHRTWAAMEELVLKGLVRNIGACNFNTQTMRDILSYARIPPAVLQVEIHPYNGQELLVRFCKEEGIVVTAFSPLGSSSYVELNMATGNDSCMLEPVVKDMAQTKGKTPAQILLRWGLERGMAIIPKSTKVARLKENIGLLDFTLSAEDMQQLATLERGRRFNDPGAFTLGMNTFCPIYE